MIRVLNLNFPFSSGICLWSEMFFCMLSLFVSRQLDRDSPIMTFCQKHQISVHHESLLSFSTLQFQNLPEGDWLFFYSKSGVKFFLEQIPNQDSLSNYKIACYGPSTAKRWQDLSVQKVSFIGNGKPKDVPHDFKHAIDENETVVFVRAKHSKMSVQRAIEAEIHCLDITAYENNRREDIQLESDYNYAMLTSPMNADAFLKACPQFDGSIITLGTTTSDHLLQNYSLLSISAIEITEAGMLEKLKHILK